MKILTLPNILTLIRLIISPLALPLLFVYLLPFNNVWINGFLALLFVVFSLTDFFDGYLARRYNLESFIGKLLDPIADKFLLYSTLVALLAADKLFFYWVILFIGREFFMMGLRILALEHKFSLPVTKIAKIKTAVQMVTITFIIFNPHQQLGLFKGFMWNGTELLLLSLTLVLSLYTARQYFRSFLTQFELKRLTTQYHQDW